MGTPEIKCRGLGVRKYPNPTVQLDQKIIWDRPIIVLWFSLRPALNYMHDMDGHAYF